MNKTRLILAAATGAYLLSVVLANWLTTHFGQWWVAPGLKVTAGTYAAGVALVARDFMQRAARDWFGGRWPAVFWSLAAISVGGLLSWWLADPFIVVASVVAFAAAELVDLTVFTPVSERRGFLPAVIASNIVSAPVDTFVFLWVAGFPITVLSITGQLVGKIMWATLVPLLVLVLIERAVHHRRKVTVA